MVARRCTECERDLAHKTKRGGLLWRKVVVHTRASREKRERRRDRKGERGRVTEKKRGGGAREREDNQEGGYASSRYLRPATQNSAACEGPFMICC